MAMRLTEYRLPGVASLVTIARVPPFLAQIPPSMLCILEV
jgi:hypothetical protein